MPADMLALRGGHTVATGKALDGVAYGDHSSGDLVPRHAGQSDAAAQHSGAHCDIVRTDTAERHSDDHLARPRQGFGDRLAVQGDFDGTGLAENQSAHRHVLQDRNRIDGTAGPSDDRQRAGNEQKLVAAGCRELL